MTKYIDLHIHSNESDGTLSPVELARLASTKNLTAIAITDHDTLTVSDEAMRTAQHWGVKLLPGIEISALYPGYTTHILGLFINPEHPAILEIIEKLRQQRAFRNPQIIKKLRQLGFDLTYEELRQSTNSTVIGRPHIGHLLANKGYAPNPRVAFTKYLSSGQPAYVPKEVISPQETCRAIRLSGGLPFLAHPWQLKQNISLAEITSVIEDLTGRGLAGIEVYYPALTKKQIEMLLKIAERYKLLISGGSDFHGANRPQVELGDARAPANLLAQFTEYMPTK